MLYRVDPEVDEAIEWIADLVDHIYVALDLGLHDEVTYEFFTRRVAARLLELPPDLDFGPGADAKLIGRKEP